MGLSHSPRIVTDGLVFCVDAANPRSYPSTNNEWNDLTPNGYNGELFNGASYSEEGNGSFSFDGTNDYISGASNLGNTSLDTSGTFSVSFWFNASAEQRYDTPFIVYRSNGVAALQLMQSTEFAGYIDLRVYNDNGTIHGLSEGGPGTAWPLNEWWYCTYVKRGNNTSALDWYFGDAEELGYRYRIYNGGTNSKIDNGSIAFGGQVATNTRYFAGNVSTLSFYNRALTTSEISQNYNATKWRFQ